MAIAEQRASSICMRFDWFTLVLGLLGGVGTISILWRESTWGVMLTQDSPSYISVAQNLLEGEGFIDLYGSYLVASPPGFPVAVAGASALGIGAVTAATYMNAIAFGLIVFSTTKWLQSRIRSRLLILWAGCACILSVVIAESAAAVMTDAIFILFVVLCLVALDQFWGTGKRSWLVLAAIWTALACLTRYIGVTVLLTAWMILLIQRDVSNRQKLKNFTTFSVIATAPLALWVLRNYIIKESFIGQVNPNGWSLPISLDRAETELIKWAFGGTGIEYINGLSERVLDMSILRNPITTALLLKASILSAVIVVAGYVGYLVVRRGYLQNWKTLTVAVTFVLTYALGLMITLPINDVSLGERFLAPLYVPILVVCTLILDKALQISPRWLVGLSGLLCLWLILQASATYSNIKEWVSIGNIYSYTSKHQADSEVMEYVLSSPLRGYIYSNDSDRLYILAHSGHSLGYSGLPEQTDDIWHRRERWTKGDSGDAYVVVFYERMGLEPWPYELGDLMDLPGMEVVTVLEDGIILKRARDADRRYGGTFLDIVLEDSELVARSNFDIYMSYKKDRLIYLKNKCDDVDTATLFFLHIDPVDQTDLPDHRRQHTFDNRDFSYNRHGFRTGEQCIAVRNLPDYAMTAIRTGQWIEGQGNLWNVEIRP